MFRNIHASKLFAYITGWEPEGRYHYTMFHWEAEGHYHSRLYTAIAPFWFSTEHQCLMKAPSWLSIDSFLILECHFGTLIGLPDCGGSKSNNFDSRTFQYRIKKLKNFNNLFCSTAERWDCWLHYILQKFITWPIISLVKEVAGVTGF